MKCGLAITDYRIAIPYAIRLNSYLHTIDIAFDILKHLRCVCMVCMCVNMHTDYVPHRACGGPLKVGSSLLPFI